MPGIIRIDGRDFELVDLDAQKWPGVLGVRPIEKSKWRVTLEEYNDKDAGGIYIWFEPRAPIDQARLIKQSVEELMVLIFRSSKSEFRAFPPTRLHNLIETTQNAIQKGAE